MAVLPADITSPKGELDRTVLFPGESSADFTAQLQAYIDQGSLKAADLTDPDEQDAAVTAWAYYRAYDAVATRMIASRSSMSLPDQGSVSTTAAQIGLMAEKAAAKLAEYVVLVPVVTTTTTTAGAWPAITSLR